MRTLESDDMTDEYNRGLQDGFRRGAIASRQNRDHFRELISGIIPFETHEDAIKRIYANPDADKSAIQSMADGVDLYVMVPEPKGEVIFSDLTTNKSNE